VVKGLVVTGLEATGLTVAGLAAALGAAGFEAVLEAVDFAAVFAVFWGITLLLFFEGLGTAARAAFRLSFAEDRVREALVGDPLARLLAPRGAAALLEE